MNWLESNLSDGHIGDHKKDGDMLRGRFIPGRRNLTKGMET
jgi:hypothetical protein